MKVLYLCLYTYDHERNGRTDDTTTTYGDDTTYGDY